MIIERGKGRDIVVRYRNNKGERKIESVRDYWPYCFVETDNAYLYDAVRKEDGFVGAYGEDLTKLVAAEPYQIVEIREKAESLGHKTWEANIPYTNRVMTDRLLNGEEPIENYKHRVWYLDCEWNPVTNKMRVIVVKDSFTQKEYVWFVNPSLAGLPSETYHKYGDYEYETPAKGFGNERLMLVDFLRHMDAQDPDVITGWYVTGADIKQIFERCNRNGIAPAGSSPMRKIRYEFGDWAQPIVGRNCIDLMVAFSKLWEMKNGKLPGYKLDDVAHEVLGQKKIELPDGHDTYLSDLPLYLHYCRQDVRLLPLLDEKINAIEYYLSLQHIVQCDIRTTPFITKMFSSLALQDLDWGRRIPTKPQFDKVPYTGADVMTVDAGVYDNVGILDIKAMYHSNASLHNISWETLDPEGKNCGNGTTFNMANKGMLVRQMDKMTELRNVFKVKLMLSDSDSEKDKWDTMQFACKSLVASMYGVAGDAKYGLYHPEVAAAITYTSRSTLDRLKTLCNDAGYKVYYGHTDSVFVGIPSPEAGQDLVVGLNAQMKPIEVEFEKWCDRMLLMAKNRYAGNVTWTDGAGHPPKLYIKGIEMKQSRMPQIMKDSMNGIIGGILANIEEKTITDNIKELVLKVSSGEIDKGMVCMKGKLERNLSDYKQLSGASAGAAWANEYLGKGYRAGSFFLVTLNAKGKYMAFDDPEELDGLYEIGYKELADRFIIKKIQPYYEMMGWDLQPLHNVIDGKGRLQWI